ncbi:DUF6804 family protein [Microbacterium sp. M3]|uniref:DUF6804 family protein n=1 Tax=Microbacterium arthrosphaerae TaxID=792652 RepID=A0ABU4GWV7_9MICO|nr:MULTISPECIES: DUF6804 family protein [Microbacterium]MDW4571561.1 DUF6804 family protein [Microbacterium arthrosphaerae]MDW7605416.1 DUF6804 family protein [Microbacterium sp. M3]
MTRADRPAASLQRNALAPGLLAAIALFLAPLLIGGDWFLFIRFVVAILAVIVLWFAVQARQWWWVPVFAAIAVIWNPVFPFPFSGPVWIAAQPAAAIVFLVAGATIKTPRA